LLLPPKLIAVSVSLVCAIVSTLAGFFTFRFTTFLGAAFFPADFFAAGFLGADFFVAPFFTAAFFLTTLEAGLAEILDFFLVAFFAMP